MRRNLYTRHKNKIINDINLTNLIDVTMVILIVYILIAPLVEQGIDITLPQSSPHAIKQEDTVTVNISKDGKLYISKSEVSLQDLTDLVKSKLEQKPETGVVIKADKNVNYGIVINVLDELNNAGITNVGLATEIKKI